MYAETEYFVRNTPWCVLRSTVSGLCLFVSGAPSLLNKAPSYHFVTRRHVPAGQGAPFSGILHQPMMYRIDVTPLLVMDEYFDGEPGKE